jgi:hypothetical protein
MDFDAALATLRSWQGRPVVVVLEPDHSVMEGRLREIDAAGIDGAMFTVSPTGVSVAMTLFRDAFAAADLDDDGTLRVRQGRVELLVTPQGETAAPPPAR